jgi:hypothetical protein
MSAFLSAWRFAAVPVVLLVAAPASAQLLQRKDLSYPMALTIATGALEDCKAKGYAVSVVVVDRGGDVMVALRANDAGPHTMENARRKAYTARTFKMTSRVRQAHGDRSGAPPAGDAARRIRIPAVACGWART